MYSLCLIEKNLLVADMEGDMVADKVADKVTDTVTRWLTWSWTFWPIWR